MYGSAWYPFMHEITLSSQYIRVLLCTYCAAQSQLYKHSRVNRETLARYLQHSREPHASNTLGAREWPPWLACGTREQSHCGTTVHARTGTSDVINKPTGNCTSLWNTYCWIEQSRSSSMERTLRSKLTRGKELICLGLLRLNVILSLFIMLWIIPHMPLWNLVKTTVSAQYLLWRSLNHRLRIFKWAVILLSDGKERGTTRT